MNEKKQINKGTRQKKSVENSTQGSAPPPPRTAEGVENFQKNMV